MNFLNYLSIRTKLVLLSLIPIIGLLFYLQNDVREQLAFKDRASEVIRHVGLIEQLSKVLHEFQQERVLALMFQTRQTDELKDRIVEQHQNTDRAISGLYRFLSYDTLTAYRIDLEALDSTRLAVIKVRPVQVTDAFYQNVKSTILNNISEILRSAGSSELKNHFEDHLFLLYAKEFLAQTRSSIAAVITRGEFRAGDYGAFCLVKGKFEVNISKFRASASPELASFFEPRYNRPVVSQAYEMMDQAYTGGGKELKLEGDEWWSVITSYIHILEETADYSSDIIRKKASSEVDTADQRLFGNILVGSITVTLIALLVTFTLKGIIQDIVRVKNAADLMAAGDLTPHLVIKSADEMGALASSFNKMVLVNKKFSFAADRIGEGDYNVTVDVRSKTDTLGIALNRMKNSLQKLSDDNAARTWLLTGNRKVNDAMRGEMSLQGLAEAITVQLVEHLNAQVACFYLAEDRTLRLAANYAYNDGSPRSIAFGQGLVGQAALGQKPIAFNDVPIDQLRINSSLLDCSALQIIVFPFVLHGEVKAVAEIGSVRAFREIDMEFIHTVSENISIAINGAQSRAKMVELLEETQAQADELKSQQKALEQSNEELQEKTQLLQESEGELKAQQEILQSTNEALEEKAGTIEAQNDMLAAAKKQIERKADDLELARKRLEGANKELESFSYSVSHDLRAPLRALHGHATVLEEDYGDVLDTDGKKVLGRLKSNVEKMDQLINDLLAFSKIGQKELRKSTIDMTELVTAVITEALQMYPLTQIRIDPLPSVQADSSLLRQVWLNLISNAMKYSSKKDAPLVEISGKAFDNRLEYYVKDNGAGFDMAYAGKLFRTFQRLHDETEFQGTGVGLAIVHRIITKHGGDIRAEAQPEKGAVFYFTLPKDTP